MTPPTYGIHNPHPLSQLRAELGWEGKVDEDGDRCEVGMANCSLSIQDIYQRLTIAPDQLAAFCEQWRIAELALFGSILRQDFRVNGNDPSDVDLLFSYLPSSNMSLLQRARMKIELEALLQRPVDLVMTIEVMESHNPIRKRQILESARVIYVKG